MTDQSAIFGGPKLPIVKFEKVGDNVQGVVTAVRVKQDRQYKTGELMFWPPAKGAPVPLKDIPQDRLHLYSPKMGLVITFNDEVNLYASDAILKAVTAAVRAAGANEVEVGSTGGVRFSGTSGEHDRKEFEAKWIRPGGGN